MFYPSGLSLNYIIFTGVPLLGAVLLFQNGYWYVAILCLLVAYGGYKLARHIEDWFWEEIRKDNSKKEI